MTTEQKAKAYDEAIKKAESLYKVSEPMSGCNVIIETLFPELKESEDERIKQKLIHLVRKSYEYGGYSLHKDEADMMTAWIERQGEHANFRNKIQIGDKVTRNEDGVLVNLSQLNRVAKVEEKQGEQKPTDEEMKALLRTEYEKGRADALAEMQKSNWSEEDEDVLEDVEEVIINYWHGQSQEDLLDWLKSLRHHSQWKPSDEQMIAISTAINVLGKGTLNGKQLIELQEQLKRLKGE